MVQQRRTDIKQRGYFPLPLSIIYSLFLLFVIVSLNSCGFSSFGKADVTPFRIKAPEGLVGLAKSQIINKLGLPEGGITDEKGTEYGVS